MPVHELFPDELAGGGIHGIGTGTEGAEEEQGPRFAVDLEGAVDDGRADVAVGLEYPSGAAAFPVERIQPAGLRADEDRVHRDQWIGVGRAAVIQTECPGQLQIGNVARVDFRLRLESPVVRIDPPACGRHAGQVHVTRTVCQCHSGDGQREDHQG